MKRAVVPVAVVLVLILGYLWASPYITLLSISKAFHEKDSEALSENVDFPTVRQNLKDQLHAVIGKGAGDERKGNPFSSLGVKIGSKMIDVLVDSAVKPGTVIALAEKRPGATSSGDEKGGFSWKKSVEKLNKGRSEYDSFSSFSYYVPTDDGEELRFVLTRSGLGWKVSNFIMPTDKLSRQLQETPSSSNAAPPPRRER